MHSRRARPTLRVLQQDLTSGWTSPRHQRHLAEERYDELHPLSELPHPIIAKAVGSFGADLADDNFVGPIASSTLLRLLEIKSAQWRGAVWVDPESGVCWLVAAGLAKGEHKDHDDFYRRIKRDNDSGDLAHRLPTEEDERLLKRETAARLLTEWELEVQRRVLGALRVVHEGASHRIEILHPIIADKKLAEIDMTVEAVRDDGYEADEIALEIVAAQGFVGSELVWQLTTRVLIALSPPVQGWDRHKDTYSNIAEPGAWTERVAELGALVEANDLEDSELGTTSHYVHTKHLAGNTIEGRAMRAMCGVYFVPMQDHESMPKCEKCSARFSALPG